MAAYLSDHEISSKIVILVGSAAVLCCVVAFVYKTLSSSSIANMSEGAAASDLPVANDEVTEKKVLVLGLDGAGKSSLLLALSKNDTISAPTPTTGYNVISVQTDSTALNIWEIGGNENTRKYWNNFYADSDLLVFVVDSSNTERLGEARSVLHDTLQDPAISTLPLLIVANKQDEANAKSAEDMVNLLDLSRLSVQYQLVCTQVPVGAASVGIEQLEKLLISTPAPL